MATTEALKPKFVPSSHRVLDNILKIVLELFNSRTGNHGAGQKIVNPNESKSRAAQQHVRPAHAAATALRAPSHHSSVQAAHLPMLPASRHHPLACRCRRSHGLLQAPSFLRLASTASTALVLPPTTSTTRLDLSRLSSGLARGLPRVRSRWCDRS